MARALSGDRYRRRKAHNLALTPGGRFESFRLLIRDRGSQDGRVAVA